ncbi:MAG: LLM class flavin-dependent oxidoreductase [Candidatus Binatia bacterium]|jgi:5,10-methylenetetrahydromethanopterin reductase
MDYGIALASSADSWKLAKRAEELGFSHAWFYDTQMLCADVFVAMAAAAVYTSHIRLGTGVLIPTNRIAPVAANALASLNKLAPGRIIFGVGTGFTGRLTMGLGPMKLAELAEYVRVVRKLLTGERVEWQCEGKPRKIQFLNPEAGLINIQDPIPVHLSAMGPKARKLAAEIAEGWINFIFAPPLAVVDVEAMLAEWRAAGRDAAGCYTTGFTLGCVLSDGEPYDSLRAKAQAGPLAAVMLHALLEREMPGGLGPEIDPLLDKYRTVYETYEPADARYLTLHRGHLLFLRPEEQPLITAELIRDFTLTGTRAALADRIRALRDAGYRQLAVQLVPGHEDALEDWVRVFEKV